MLLGKASGSSSSEGFVNDAGMQAAADELVGTLSHLEVLFRFEGFASGAPPPMERISSSNGSWRSSTGLELLLTKRVPASIKKILSPR